MWCWWHSFSIQFNIIEWIEKVNSLFNFFVSFELILFKFHISLDLVFLSDILLFFVDVVLLFFPFFLLYFSLLVMVRPLIIQTEQTSLRNDTRNIFSLTKTHFHISVVCHLYSQQYRIAIDLDITECTPERKKSPQKLIW